MASAKDRMSREGYPSWVTVFVTFCLRRCKGSEKIMRGMKANDIKQCMKLFLREMHPDKFQEVNDIALAELQTADFNKWKEARGGCDDICMANLLDCSEQCRVNDSRECPFHFCLR